MNKQQVNYPPYKCLGCLRKDRFGGWT